jgi:hypothetical protein
MLKTKEILRVEAELKKIDKRDRGIDHLTVVCFNEWQALYCNGELIYENGSITLYDLERSGEGDPFTFGIMSLDDTEADSYVTMTGSCPEEMKDFLLDRSEELKDWPE